MPCLCDGNYGVQRQRGILATFTGFEVSTDHGKRKHPLHVYTGCKQAKTSPYTSYTEGRKTDQLCILGVYLKKYTLTGMPFYFWSPQLRQSLGKYIFKTFLKYALFRASNYILYLHIIMQCIMYIFTFNLVIYVHFRNMHILSQI